LRGSIIATFCVVLSCSAAGARSPGRAGIYIGAVSVEGLELGVAAEVRERLSQEFSALGLAVSPMRRGAAGVLEVRVLRSGDMVRINMSFLDQKGVKVLEIATTGAAEGFPASVSFRRDLKRGLDALGLAAPRPEVEQAPAIESAYAEPGEKKTEVSVKKTPPAREPGLFKWGWVVAGVGGALLAGGAVTGSLALSENDDLNKKCPGGICEPGHESQIDRLESLGYATDILLSVGAATVVAGVILLLFYPDDDVSVRPAVSPGFSGAVVEGRF